MGKTIVMEEKVSDYISSLYGNCSWQIGLMIGQLSMQRDYVVHFARSPEQSDSPGADMECKPGSLEELDSSWIIEHAHQVSRMLTGGLDIAGIFAFGPPDMLSKAQGKIRQVLYSIHKKVFHRPAAYFEDSEARSPSRILLQICSKTKKITCRTINVSDPKATPNPAEVKYQSFVSKWLTLETSFSLRHLHFTVPKKLERSDLQTQVMEVYDLEKKLVMFKGSNWWHPNLGPIVQIHDFNTGIGYKMSTPSEQNQHGCHIFNLTDKNWDATDAGNHYIRMKTTQELFRNPVKNSTATIVYKGVSAVRGIAADVWVSKGMSCHLDRNNKSYECVVEWYFSKPSWNLSSGFAVAQHQVPLKMVIYSQHGKASINVFNFDAEPVQPTVFDIKPCFSPDQQVFIQFSLKGGKYDYVRWRNFMLAVTQSISSAAGVSLIRVNGMRLSFEGQGNIIVTFILLGKPAFKAQSVEQPLSEKALKDALNALKNAVESGKFKMKFNNEILQAERSSFFHGYKGTPSASPVIPTEKPSDKPQPGGGGSSNKKGVPGGAVAGVAFVMLAVGILGGLGIAHVIMKRRGTSLFQYQRHE